MKMKQIIGLSAAALLLVATLNIGEALAYFTTYTSAAGSRTITLGSPDPDIEEEFDDWIKHVSVTNNGTADCYIRVQAFKGSQYKLTYTDTNGKWTLKDGYYYYSDIVPAKGTAEGLDIQITLPDGGEVESTQDFNVVVVEEYTPVLYQEDGTPYADWSLAGAAANREGAE